MARISQYDQDSTLNKLDKVVGTDSATGATKNYTIDSMIGLVNSEDLVNVFDGVSYSFKSYEAGSTNPRGIINLNAGAAASSPFSGISQIYVSVLDKHGNSIANYLDDTVNSFIRIVQKTDIDIYGVLEVTAVANHDGGAYKLLTVTPRVNNGNIVVNEEYFVSNYSAVFDQDFSDDSVTEFSDVSSAGSGQIITNAERTSLNNFTANGLLHADVVDNVSSTAADVPLSANQGKILKGLIDSINTLLTSNNVNLDSLQEVVDYIEANKNTLDNLGIGNISGLQAALDAKQNTEVGKGLSAEDFTTALLTKLNGIAASAEVNVQSNWGEANTGSDAFIQNKPADLTNLTIHGVTELNDVTSAGSGAIITSTERNKIDSTHGTFIGLSSAERTKLSGIDVNTGTRVVTDGTDSITVPPANAEQNVQSNWNETDTNADSFIQNKPSIPTNTNTTYDLTVHDSGDDAIIRLAGSDSTNDNVTLVAGNNVTLTPNSSNVTVDIDLTTAAVTNGSTSLVTGDHVFDYADPKFARKDQAETFSNNVTVQGDLTVSGTTTTVNSANLNIGDNIITLNSDHTGSATQNAGIEINRGSDSDVALRWNEGTDKWEITEDGTNYSNISNASGTTGKLAKFTSSKELGDSIITESSGDIGIGTTSPSAKLEIKGTGTTNTLAFKTTDASSNETFYIKDGGAAGVRYFPFKIGVPSGTTNVTNSRFQIATTTGDFIVLNDGKTGIGTTSPSEKLEVIGNVRADVSNGGGFMLTGASTSGLVRNNATGVALRTNTTDRLIIDSSGNVGIGTGSPERDFHLHRDTLPDIHITNSDSGSSLTDGATLTLGGLDFFINNREAGNLVLSTSGTEAMRIDSSGRVGIGTTSPSVSLDINDTDAIKVPVGTTAQRPTAANGMLRYSTTDNQFEGYADGAWGAIAGSGGGSGTIVKQTFSATGSATFTLANTIADIDNISVYVSGVYQYPSNYTISGANITFVSGSIPAAGTNNVHVVHTTTVASITEVGSVFVDQFTGNGSATQFSPLGTAPTSENNTDVYIDGVYQQKNAYSIAGTAINFSDPPDAGAYIEVKTTGTIAPSAVNAVTTTLVSDSFTATADQTSFTLTNGTPSAKELTMVFVQGVYQAKANYSLLTSPTRIVLTEGAEVGETVEVISVSGANLTTSPVTSVNGQTGAVTFNTYTAPTVYVVNTATTAVANSVYVLTANLTLTLPASPSSGDSIKISNRSGVATCVLARNGSNIMGSASDLTLDTASASFELIYSDATNGWVIIGQ